jgi:hypothetical protein
MKGIADMALASGLRKARVLVVGDHSPPFLGADERGLYREHEVAFYYLRSL